ncbi:MAG: prepilin-type N-terminal cleavage/methylation domain-containing protein, partial [Cyanobium sp. LacPavin_0920_WC12_MAG_62_9]|nr:prepilin-type N-terminal cleavage/methylation domain-containing protein [Cyanobium sp. LacPavin_0920_WC12_MAG_62_9]
LPTLDYGFTLIELIVVVAVLTILGGIATPSVMAYIRTAHVNEGKALLNAAVSDCLRTAGSTPQNLATTTPVTLQEALAGTRATPLGYTIEKDPHCSTGLSLKATTPGMIDLYAEVKSDGTVIKKAATQADDTSSSSQVSCEQWGGKANCQDAAEIARQKAAAIAAALAAAEAERARLAAIEKQKAEAALAAAAAAEAARQAAIAQQAAQALALSQQAAKAAQTPWGGALNQAAVQAQQEVVQSVAKAQGWGYVNVAPAAKTPTCRLVQTRVGWRVTTTTVCS